jgi:hypothetical protein
MTGRESGDNPTKSGSQRNRRAVAAGKELEVVALEIQECAPKPV